MSFIYYIPLFIYMQSQFRIWYLLINIQYIYNHKSNKYNILEYGISKIL